MKAYLLALLLVFGGLYSTAQEMYSSRLWEIKHPDLKYTSYLVGTVHSGNEGLFAINDSIYWAIEQSDLVAFEIEEEKNEMNYSGTMSKMTKATRNIGFLTMECIMDLLPKYHDVPTDTLVKRYLDGMKEFYGGSVQDERGPELRSMVFDDFLTAYARFKGKKVDGIEDVQEQIKALYTYTKPQLKSIVEGYFTGEDHLFSQVSDDSVVLMAAENRYEGICTMYSEFSQDEVWGSYFKKLLDDRNHQMADYVLEHSKEEPMLCAVGLAHMCGPVGVIALLQKEGYQIRPIKIYDDYKRDRSITWHAFESDEFKTVLPKGVDSIVRKYNYGGFGGGFMSTQISRNKNVLMTPEGAVWFEYKGKNYSYEEADEEDENELVKSLSAYIGGMDFEAEEEDDEDEAVSNTLEAVLEAVAEAVEEAAEEVVNEDGDDNKKEEDLAIALDGTELTDSLINGMIDSMVSLMGASDSNGSIGQKSYPSKFVEFWSKVSDGRKEAYVQSMDEEDDDKKSKIDTISLGKGLGNYTVEYKDDVIFEYKMPGDEDIILRMRGDEIVMKRPELLDYFRKAVLKEED